MKIQLPKSLTNKVRNEKEKYKLFASVTEIEYYSSGVSGKMMARYSEDDSVDSKEIYMIFWGFCGESIFIEDVRIEFANQGILLSKELVAKLIEPFVKEFERLWQLFKTG